MKVIKVFLCGIFCAGVLPLMPTSSCAAEFAQNSLNPPREITLNPLSYNQADVAHQVQIGNRKYSKDRLIHDFLQAAISRRLWYDGGDQEILNVINARYSWGSNSDTDNNLYDTLKEQDPRFAEYVYRKNGLPDPFVVYKWTRPISIGLDWQKIRIYKDGQAREYIPFGLGSEDKRRPEHYPLFKDQLSSLIPLIKEMTGLDVLIVDPNDPKEFSQDYARIRVVPMVEPDKWRDRSKNRSGHIVASIEESLNTAVKFASESGGMGGFIVPDADNSIGYAACKINPLLEEKRVRALITECVVRVLGLSGSLEISKNSILDRSRDTKPSKNQMSEDFEGIVTAASILYCPKIKPGMTMYEVIKVLKLDSACFQKNHEEMR